MKLAIHDRVGSFSDYWISYCKANKILYKVVNCYDTDIIQQIKDCDVLMWHHHHEFYKDNIFAKQLLFSIEHSGKMVFPNFNTAWHFDDKVGQKYLLESIGAPLVLSYVFYDKKNALAWANTTNFPKVFKLRRGAGSANVELVKNRKEAKKKINKAFVKGFTLFNGKRYFLEKFKRYRSGKENFKKVVKAFGRMLISTEHSKIMGNEKGYVYFQDFIPNNDGDTRVTVIGDRAFVFKRMVRRNDFRASGSGVMKYDKNLFDKDTIRIAFDIANKIGSQCCAIDFVYDNGSPLVIEFCYGFPSELLPWQGYWDKDLNFYEGALIPSQWMIEEVIKQLEMTKC